MTGAFFTFDGAFAVLFGIACISIAFLRVAISGTMTFFDWSLLFIGLIYGLSAPLVVDAVHEDPNRYPASHFLTEHYGMYGVHTIIVILGTLGLYTGWMIATWVGKNRKRPRRYLFEGLAATRAFNRVLWAFLVMAVIAQVLYSLDYGGLTGVSDYSRLVRSGLMSEAERSRFSFLKPIAGFAFMSAYGFLGLLLTKGTGRKWLAIVGFATSFAFSIYVLDTWQGRLGIATFIAILFLAVILVRRPRPVVLIIGFCAAAVFGMYSVYLMSELWDLKTSESFSAFYVTEISFIFTGFWAEMAAASTTFRLFYDILVMPLFLLPSSWTSGWFENVQDVHTATIWGAPKGESGVTSGMPLDFITLGFLQMNVLGVFLYALLFGVVLRCLQSMVECVEISGLKAVLTSYIALRIAGFGLFYAHPEQLVASNLPLIIIILGLAITRRITRPYKIKAGWNPASRS